MRKMTKRDCQILIINMLLAALLCSLHHWVAIAKNRGDYSPFAVSPSVSSLTFDETHFYAPVPERFMLLGELPAEVDNYERRNSSAGIAFIPALVLGGMGRVFGNLEWAFIASDILFPALAFGLLYAATQGLVQGCRSRLLVAWGTLLIPWAPRTFFWRGFDSFVAPPEFTRTPQPEISFLFVLIASLLLARSLTPSANWRILPATGMASALIVYSYYFYAVAWGVTLGVLLLLTFFWKKWVLAGRITAILSMMILGSLPYLSAISRGKTQGGQTYLLARVGTYTHAPRLVPLLCFILGFLIIWKVGNRLFTEEESKLRAAVFLVLVLAGLAGLNFQVLSGCDAEHEHFWRRLILPVVFFLCGCWLLSTAERHWNRPHLLNRLVGLTLILVLLNAGARQVYVGTQIAKWQSASRAEIDLLKWAQSNVPPGSVIGTVDPDLILLIPVITADFTYVPPGLRSLTPTYEIVDRYYELASLLGLSPGEVYSIAAVPDHNGTGSHLLFALRVYGDAIAPPVSRDSEDSRLLSMSKYAETPQTFSEGYRSYHQGRPGQGRRLDYAVTSRGTPIPAPIEAHFARARIIYTNQQYQLIALR
jgi:hypothetical protein